MSALNTKTVVTITTHQGGRAHPASLRPENALRRSVASCLLWEDGFYENGVDVSQRIVETAKLCDPVKVAALAREARGVFKLRHAPLLLLSVLADMAKGNGKDGSTISNPRLVTDCVHDVISRADELCEFLAVRQKLTGKPLKKAITHQIRKGLAEACENFDEYQLAKYNRDRDIKLRDVARLVHPKAKSEERNKLYERLLKDELATPDTWEVALSGGEDKKDAFTRLLETDKLPYMALLRNLRNMEQAGVDTNLIEKAILARRGARHVLPFRFTAAARAIVRFENVLDQAMIAGLANIPQFDGTTIVLVDVSDSMNAPLSAKSDLSRMDAATTLASIFPGKRRVFSFSDDLLEVPARTGMAGIDAIRKSQPHRATYLGRALTTLNKLPHDRLVVITDEQSNDAVPNPVCKRSYMINVATDRHGVGYGGHWTHISGFSENVFSFINTHEAID